MKYIYLLIALLIVLSSCEEDYNYNTAFSAPTELYGPENIAIELDTERNVVLSWTGGGAADGSPVLYDVFFDKEGGDFSEPFYSCKSDLNTYEQLTLTYRNLNRIARQAGIAPDTSGSFIWTVRTAKGGEMKFAPASRKMTVARPDVLDIPESLYLFGTALDEGTGGYEMNEVDAGVFRIYVSVSRNGTLFFADKKDPEASGAIRFYYDSAAGQVKQGAGTTLVEAQAEAVDITVDLNLRTYVLEEHFQQPEELYIQGDVSEAGRRFAKNGDIFTLYTRFESGGSIYFTDVPNPASGNALRYYINEENKLVQGDGTTAVDATRNGICADRITVAVSTRLMTIDEIGDMRIEWVNAMSPVDISDPKFIYAGNGNFTAEFSIPTGFQHTDEENKGGTSATDARYLLKVVENGTLKRWGCNLTKDENMTIQPYERKNSAGETYAAHWIPIFEAGGAETERIIVSDYYLYSQMPNRWKANWFFKTEYAGTHRHATIYTNDANSMRLHIE